MEGINARSDSEVDSIRQYFASLELLWDFSDTIMYRNQIPLLAVPTAVPNAPIAGLQSMMVFYINADNQLDARLWFIAADSTYDPATNFTEHFNGFVFQFNWDGNMVYSYRIDGGAITAPVQQAGAVEFRNEEIMCDDGSPANVSMYEFMHYTIVWWWCGGSGGGEGGAQPPGGGMVFNNHDPFGFNNGNYNLNNPPGGGGSGTGTLTNYFNPADFQGSARKNAQMINQFKENFCLSESAPELLDKLKTTCNLSEDPDELFVELKENLHKDILPDCVKEVILADRVQYMEDTYGLSITGEELLELLGPDCVYLADNTCFQCHRTWGDRITYYVQEPGDFESRPDGISCRSFTMVNIGSAWYTGLSNVQLNMVETRPDQPKPPKSISFSFLTIQVPYQTVTGVTYNSGEAADKIAECFDYAFWSVFQQYKGGQVNATVLSNSFKNTLQIALTGYFAGGCTVTSGSPLPGVVYKPPKFNNFFEDLIDDCN